MTTLPKTISPCPIRECVAGFRFESNIHQDTILGIVYQSLKKDFPKIQQLPILQVPTQIRETDKDLQFQPHYLLSSANAKMLLGPKVVLVGVIDSYPGWSIQSQIINNSLRAIQESGVIKKTLRFGLRYINFFEFDIFLKLKLKVLLDDQILNGEETNFKTVLKHELFNSRIVIQKSVHLLTATDAPQKATPLGSVLDIDMFSNSVPLDGDFFPVWTKWLDAAHQKEKELFFGLLDPEFLTTLNPVYEHN